MGGKAVAGCPVGEQSVLGVTWLTVKICITFSFLVMIRISRTAGVVSVQLLVFAKNGPKKDNP